MPPQRRAGEVGQQQATPTQDQGTAVIPKRRTGEVSQTPPPPNKKVPFDLNHLKTLIDYKQVAAYVNSTNLPLVGRGSGRDVYKIDDQHALKIVATSTFPAGVMQNKAEIHECVDLQGKLFAKILDADEKNFLWMIVEFAIKLTPELFKNTSGGVDWQTFIGAITALHRNAKATDQNMHDFEVLNSMPFFAMLFDAIVDCKLIPDDLTNIGNWGLINGQPRIIDYGFTHQNKHAGMQTVRDLNNEQ